MIGRRGILKTGLFAGVVSALPSAKASAQPSQDLSQSSTASITTQSSSIDPLEQWGVTGAFDMGPDPVEFDVVKDANNPVLEPTAGEWDHRNIFSVSVIKEAGTYIAAYTGQSSSNTLGIGIATSTDLVNWTKHPQNPVFQPSTGHGASGSGPNEPELLRVGDTYYLYYIDMGAKSIGVATSTDLVNWTRSPNNPVLEPSGGDNWDSDFTVNPDVTYQGGLWRMVYEGSDWEYAQIGLAVAGCGTDKFQRDLRWSNPILSGSRGEPDSDGCFAPTLLPVGRMYHLIYRSKDANEVRRIRMVSQPRLHSDAYFGWNPIRHTLIEPSASGWDSAHIHNCEIWREGTRFEMLYTASNSSYAIGHATMEIGSPP